VFQHGTGPGAVPNVPNQPQIQTPMAYYHPTNQSDMCQIPSLYQNQSSLHQMNQQIIQRIQHIYTSNAIANTIQADILLQNNIPSCRNQDGGLRGDGFSW
jgi:nicotinamide mononucleotide adenylyltransferase